MNDRMFQNAVFVKSGNDLVQEIACLEDALEFLYEWPKDRRGPHSPDCIARLPAGFRQRLSAVRSQRRVQRFCQSSQNP